MTDNDAARVQRGRQIRAARKLLGWSRDRLASNAEVSMVELLHLERGTPRGRPKAYNAILRALQAAGVEFIPVNGGGAEVQLRKTL